jgi:hypothetical protein
MPEIKKEDHPFTKALFEVFVIDTKTISNRYKGRQVEYKDLSRNEEYKKLLKAQDERILADMFPRIPVQVAGNAANFHTMDMYKDPKTDCAWYDAEGLIFVKEEEIAKKLLADLQLADKDIKLSKYGRQFGSPEPKETKPVK